VQHRELEKYDDQEDRHQVPQAAKHGFQELSQGVGHSDLFLSEAPAYQFTIFRILTCVNKLAFLPGIWHSRFRELSFYQQQLCSILFSFFGDKHMRTTLQAVSRIFCTAALAACMQPSAHAALSSEELAKLAQNPVGNLISVPIQSNTNLNYGPKEGTQNIVNIQPVIPVSVGDDWNIITRTILPIISNPSLYPGDDRTNGIGDTQFSAFLSPSQPGKFIWGTGAVIQAPTHSNSELGNRNWGAGPTFVVLRLEKGSPWVYGVLANNIWSMDTSDADPKYNNGLIQPFLNYNFKSGLYLTSAPIATVNWKAEKSSDEWTVPVWGSCRSIPSCRLITMR
jgi:hypothetical protein